MPRPVTAMHGIREALRLSHAGGLSAREVATVTRLGRATVRRCLARASEHGLAWPLPEYMDDSELELRLLQRPGPRARAPAPDWEPVHREARRPGVTLQLLWMEHKERCPDGHQYTWFTQQYREWNRQLDVVLRQEHRAGAPCSRSVTGRALQPLPPRRCEYATWKSCATSRRT